MNEKSLPKGSQKPIGASIPSSLSKDICDVRSDVKNHGLDVIRCPILARVAVH
jgi:hypothetical protein